jgi:hypothetical protein
MEAMKAKPRKPTTAEAAIPTEQLARQAIVTGTSTLLDVIRQLQAENADLRRQLAGGGER